MPDGGRPARRPKRGGSRPPKAGGGAARGARSSGRELLSARLRKGLERAENPYVEEAEKLSARFVSESRARFGAEMGFDLDHVRRLDNVIRNGREAFDDELILAAGFHLGEMLRRAYGGRYQWHPGKDALSLEVEGLVTFPIEKVRQVVAAVEATGPADGLEAYLMVLAKRIATKRAERRAAGDDGPR